MKLVIAIVQDDDAGDLLNILIEHNFKVTKLATTGGFLKAGNTTLIIGVEENDVDKVIAYIEQVCKTRKQVITAPFSIASAMPYSMEIEVGGANIFVLDVDKFIKI